MAILVTLAAGCSSSGHAASRTSTPPASTPRTFTTTYGEDAALIASHIRGCAGVTAESIGNGAATGMVGKAACTLLGHQVVIYTWRDAQSQASAAAVISGSLVHYATGTGWDQVFGDDAAPDAQARIAQTVAASLGGKAT